MNLPPPPGRQVPCAAAGWGCDGPAPAGRRPFAIGEHRGLEPLEIRYQFLGRPVAGLRVLIETGRDDSIQGGKLHRRCRGHGGRLDLQHPRDRRGRGRGLEGIRPGRHLVDQHAKRKQIGPEVDLLAPGLLGRHVRGRAEHRAGLGQVGLRRGVGPRDAEVENLDDAGRRAEDVLGFQIAVHDTVHVGGGQRPGELCRDVDDLVRRQRTALQQRAQGRAGHVLARQIERVVDLLERVDRGDPRMGQRCGRPGLLAQPFAAGRIAAQARGERLERHAPRQPHVIGQIHHPHPAAADLLADQIGADLAAFERLTRLVHEQVRRRLVRRRFDEAARAVVRRQQRRDLGPQRRVAGAGLVEEGVPVPGVALERGVEHRAHLRPLFRRHRCAPLQALVRATHGPGSTGA